MREEISISTKGGVLCDVNLNEVIGEIASKKCRIV